MRRPETAPIRSFWPMLRMSMSHANGRTIRSPLQCSSSVSTRRPRRTTEASTTSSTHNSRGGGVVTPAIPRRYHAQTIKLMYAPCMPLSTCLPSLLARHARVPSLLLYLPPSGLKLVLRQSHHLSLIPRFIFPIQSTEKPSSCAKSGTVALNAPSSRTSHSSVRASKRNRPNRCRGTFRFVNRNRRLERQHCPRVASLLPRSMSSHETRSEST